MRKRTITWSRWYVKYIIKNPAIFLSFVVLGISAFLILSSTTRLDQFQTQSAVRTGDRCIETEAVAGEFPDKIYLYSNRNDQVYAARVERSEREGELIRIYLSEETNPLDKLPETITIDLPTGQISLLDKLILKKEG